MNQAHVLITGATDGIGLALARRYHARGATVTVVGRRPAGQIDPELRASYCRADLAQPYAADLVAEYLRRRGVRRLDLLVHCAGVGSYGPAEAQPPEEIAALLDVNLRAPLALTHALLPLLEAARGRVALIGSVAAALPAPEYAVYGATKAALEGLGRSLRAELAGRVAVQVVHPGATRTAMHEKVGAPLEQMGWERFPPPDRVARQIERAIESGAGLVTVGLGNRLLRLAGRHLGGMVGRAVARRQPSPGGAPAAPAGDLRHIVITGGADGIGRALAGRYAQPGRLVTLVDRDAERGEAACAELRALGAEAALVRADLGDPRSVAAALRELAALPPADLVVHSAGISAVGRFGALPLARQLAVLDVNLRAPLLLTAGLLRAGRVAPGGALVFIASLSVFSGYPGAAAYAASKDGVAAYARSMRAALAGRGVHVLTVYPGPTRTAHARRYSPDNRREARRMPPERLAALIARAVERREDELVPGAANRLAALAGRLLPGVMERAMRAAILDQLDRPAAAHLRHEGDTWSR